MVILRSEKRWVEFKLKKHYVIDILDAKSVNHTEVTILHTKKGCLTTPKLITN